MNRTVSNFSGKTTFPLDIETLAAIQENQNMLSMLGAVAGHGAILYGGAKTESGGHNEGYVYLKTADYAYGEILYFPADSKTFNIEAKSESVTANGQTFTNIHTVRKLVSTSEDTGTYKYAEFFTLDQMTVKELKAKIDQLETTLSKLNNPVGTIHIWAGTTSNIPKGYLLCNGRSIYKYTDDTKKTEIPLYKAIGDLYSEAINNDNGLPYVTNESDFRIPDLRGRFVVGLHPEDNSGKDKFNKIANTGGEKEHKLMDNEIPPHKHEYIRPVLIEGIEGGIGSGSDRVDHPHSTENGGGTPDGKTIPHQNLPPYYVLSYIIKAE